MLDSNEEINGPSLDGKCVSTWGQALDITMAK
jgi:hypothetical protein